MHQVLIIAFLCLPSLAEPSSEPLEREHSEASFELLQRRIALDPAQPSATAHFVDGCSDDCIPAVFVVSSGRAGSATIMHMLNQIPGFDLNGHKNGMLGSFLKLHEALDDKWKQYKRSTLYSWVHSSDRNESELRCALRMMILGELDPPSKAHVVGFKDTDWQFDDQLRDLSLLLEVLPCSKIIFSYRNDLEEQLLSMRKVYGEYDYFGVRQANERIQEFAKQHPDRTFKLPLEDFSVKRFNDLLHFLGEDVNCHFVNLMQDNRGEEFTRTNESRDDVIRCVPPAGSVP